MPPVPLLLFCSPYGDTEIICQRGCGLLCLRFTAQREEQLSASLSLLILLVEQRPKRPQTDKGLATKLGYLLGPNPAASGSWKQGRACGIRPLEEKAPSDGSILAGGNANNEG